MHAAAPHRRPNVVFVFADEWRGQATGYAGDPNCETPVLDALAQESLSFPNATAGCPVCCPYRASLMTGQYPLTHRVIINDVELDPGVHSIARAFGAGGYDTAYIGKWHIYGSPDGKYGRRRAVVPRAYQLGFDYWKAFECCHDYNQSPYFFNDDPAPRLWEGYDALAQSNDAAAYIRARAAAARPFLLMLSWGPPHFPLHTAPEPYRQRYAQRTLTLRPNVPAALRAQAQEELRGYYAHIAALDDCLAVVRDAVRQAGIENDTIFVFTADHGDMRQCQDWGNKQVPFDESVLVPFLLRYPPVTAGGGRRTPVPIDAPDIMPTLLGLAGLPVPAGVEGTDWSPVLRGERSLSGDEAALLIMPSPFSELSRNGLTAYRGLRTARYTYARDTRGPWLLFDNEADPYQLRNLVRRPEHRGLQDRLDQQLHRRLCAMGDEFRDGPFYLERLGLAHYAEATTPLDRQWRYPWDQL